MRARPAPTPAPVPGILPGPYWGPPAGSHLPPSPVSFYLQPTGHSLGDTAASGPQEKGQGSDTQVLLSSPT